MMQSFGWCPSRNSLKNTDISSRGKPVLKVQEERNDYVAVRV